MTPSIQIAFRLLLLCVFLAAANARGQGAIAVPPGVEHVTTLEGISEYRLANGLRTVLVPDTTKPSITVNIVYLVGSRHEGYGETGMAHLLEHMLFKGTTIRPKLNDEFAPRAARRNGTTSFDRTNYFETFPNTGDNLKWALEMEADRMVNSRVSREDLDTEMTVVRNEYERGENETRRVLISRVNSVAFDWHNYSHTAIGNRSDIENVGIENLRAFYRTYYQPDNAVLVVAGNFDPSQALDLIASAFGRIPKPARILPTLWTTEATQDGERFFYVRRSGGTPTIAVAYRIPGALHGDTVPVDFAGAILASGASSRLHKVLVETGKAASISFTHFQTVDPGLAYFVAELPPGGNVEEVQKIIIDTVESFGNGSTTSAEIGRLKNQQARQSETAVNTTETMAIALTASIARGDWRLFFFSRERYASVTGPAVTAAARKYFVRDNRTVGIYLPTDAVARAEITAAPSAQTLLKDFKGAETSVASAEAFDPSPENIEQRTTVRQLPNGLKVALLPKKTRGGTVQVRFTMHFGDLESLRGRSYLSGPTTTMLTRGAAGMTRQQLSDRMAKLKIAGSPTAFRTTGENLPEALRLMARILREPSFPEAEFEQMRAQMLTALERVKSDPRSIASDWLARHFNVYAVDDPRYPASTEETIERVRAMKVDDLRQFHRDFFGASHAELVIVGDFDEKELMGLIESTFGSWNARVPYKRLGTSFREVAAKHERVVVPDKANAMFVTRLMIPLRGDEPDYAALLVANYLFGGAGPTSRLNGRIRQREGLSYGVSSALATANRIDAVANFSANASVAPQNVAKLETIFREELERAYREGFSDAEVTAAKAAMLQANEQQRSSDEALANSWIDRLHRGKTFAEAREADERIRAVTREQVNAAVRRYWDPARVSSVSVGSF